MEVVALDSNFSHTDFLLHGFPGITESRLVLVVPILLIFVMILVGNVTMVYIIWKEAVLHQPAYILMSFLFSGNIVYAMTTMPKFLVGLLFEVEQISLAGCLTQMFFMYSAGTFSSSVLLLMAVDRYMAIVLPLRYHLLMTMRTLAFLVFLSSLRTILFVSLIVSFAAQIHFCSSNVILNFACENMSVLKLGCGDVSGVQALGLLVRIVLVVVDGTCVVLSYMKILHTVMSLVSGRARHRARSTCSTHLLVTTVTYMSGLSSSIVYRMGSSISSDLQNTTSLLNFIIPAVADPAIYGAKMEAIRKCLTKNFKKTNHQ